MLSFTWIREILSPVGSDSCVLVLEIKYFICEIYNGSKRSLDLSQ